MTTTSACGLGYGMGLVCAVTAAIIWRSRFVDELIRWAGSRGNPPAYRHRFPRIGRR